MTESNESPTPDQDPRPQDEAVVGATPPAAESAPDAIPEVDPEALAAAMDEIDKEVDGALDSMAAAMEGRDDSEGKSAAVGETAAPGDAITGTVVGISGDEVFLEFGAKSQGTLSRSEFGKKEPVEVGRRVDVTVERFDEESGLLIVHREGAIQRASWTGLKVGAIVEGRATGVIRGGLEMDLQGIRAFMPASQTSIGQLKDISVLLNQKLRCVVTEFDRRGKNVVVSHRKVLEAERKESAEKLKAELEVGQIHSGVVRNVAEFGAFVDIGGLEGLVHIRELKWGVVDKASDEVKTGQKVQVKVLKIDHEKNRLSLSIKQALANPWVGVADRYPQGMAVKAKIVRIADFGSFAELEPGIDGLIPISEMGWSRVTKPSDVAKVGDIVDAVVIRVEPGKQRLALSMKKATADPWVGVLESFEVQSIIKGRVTRLADFGAFVELVPGVEGLVHISELSEHRVKTCGDVVSVGKEIEARVLGVDKENRRISLSIKQVAAPDPASNAEAAAAEAPAPKKRKKPLRGGLSSHYEW